MERLLANSDFTELMGFWNDEVKRIVLNENLDLDVTTDQLKARQIFNRFIYDIINEANVLLNEKQKDNE